MTNNKTAKKKTRVREVNKPFLTGNILDANTARNALLFLGSVIVIYLVALIACVSAAFDSMILRILMNGAVIFLIMMIIFNNGNKKGAEDVARGEILYQKQEKGQAFSESEKRICYHPAKGFATALIGTLPFLIPALILAFSTSLQMTGAGALPSWMQAYLRRSEIGNALGSYTNPESMNAVDYIRTAIRICILPYVNIIGSSDKHGMLVLERISPLIMLIPAVFYGTGYMRGKRVRTQIHTAISENEKKRNRKDKKKAAQRRNARPHEPEQLN